MTVGPRTAIRLLPFLADRAPQPPLRPAVRAAADRRPHAEKAPPSHRSVDRRPDGPRPVPAGFPDPSLPTHGPTVTLSGYAPTDRRIVFAPARAQGPRPRKDTPS